MLPTRRITLERDRRLVQKRVDDAGRERLHDAPIAGAQMAQSPKRTSELPNTHGVCARANLTYRVSGRSFGGLRQKAIGFGRARFPSQPDLESRHRRGAGKVADAAS